MHKEINCECRHSNSPLTGSKCNHVILGILKIQSLAGIFSCNLQINVGGKKTIVWGREQPWGTTQQKIKADSDIMYIPRNQGDGEHQGRQLNTIRPTRQGEAKLASWHPLIQPELRSPQLCMCYISACYTSFVLKTDHFYIFFIYFISYSYNRCFCIVLVFHWVLTGCNFTLFSPKFIIVIHKNKINNLCMCKPIRW